MTDTSRTNMCRNYQLDLKAFCDGELPLLRRVAVSRHLRDCARCQHEVETMKTVTQELQNNETAAPISGALREKLIGVADTPQPDTQPKPIVSAPSKMRQWMMSSALGAALLLVMFGTTMTFMGRRVSTVFNNAQNALNTSIGDEGFSSQADSTFGRDEFQSKAPARPEAIRGRNLATSSDATLPVVPPLSGSTSSLAEPMTRRVHNQASISVTVSDLENKSATLEQMTKSVGGFVASNDLSSSSQGLRRASLVIKVPVEKFDEVLRKIAEYGFVTNKKVSGEDITTRVSDAMQEKNVLSQELSQKMAQLQKKRKPDAQTQYEARMIRIQLAQAQARLNILEKMARLSTINVQLQEKARPKPVSGGFLDELNQTKTAATGTFMIAARWPIIAFMWILAYAPLWIPLFFIWRYVSRTYLRHT